MILLLGSTALRAQTYCTPTYSYACTSGDYIQSFSTTGGSTNITNNNTGCSNTTTNFTLYSQTVTAIQGTSVNFSFTNNPSWGQGYKIYVDWNNNGILDDAGEIMYQSASTIGGGVTVTGTIAVPFVTPGTKRLRIRCAYATTTFDPCNLQSFGETEDYNFTVVAATPCTGQPTAGTVSPAGPISGCPGNTYTFNTTGTTLAGSLTYQWMQSTNGGVSYTNAAGTSNGASYTTPALAASVRYHMVVTCTPSGLKDSTADVLVNIAGPVYGAVPYTMDFENWVNGCGTTDLPSNNWTNQPSTGDRSWRRDDQGVSASWTSPTAGAFTPVSAVNAHSARFHSYYSTPYTPGSLSLYVDCSTFIGPKELQLYLRTDPGTTYPNDSLKVYLSTDGGATFIPMAGAQYGPGNGSWQFKSQIFASNSATTVIRFDAKTNYNYYTDMGLDYVRILPPCAGKPTAGVVAPVTPCPNANFTLQLNGTSQAAGLTYQWQYLSNANVWTNINPGNTAMITYNISQPTNVRAIVNCTNSSQADTTPAYLVNLASFYYCYCQSMGNYNYSSLSPNIGNVTITTQPANVTILNNGNASPATNNPNSLNFYTDFRYTVAPMCLYRDSLYKMFISEINPTSFYASTVTAFIDYNRDGTFNTTGAPAERLLTKNITSATVPASDTFRIPHIASIGTTGMRVIIVYGTGATINPCGTLGYGETEDYLVNICYPPCNGPSNPGIAVSTDTVVCPGYTIDLADTTHEMLRSGLVWGWQSSINNGVSWTNVPGSLGKDTLNNVLVTGPIKYRLRMRCSNTADTTYSNVINITNGQNYQCYAISQSSGNKASDSSDIGTFSIGNFVMPVGMSAGPHIKNPLAIRRRTDYTQANNMIILNADSTYPIAIYHTMKSATHGDAIASVFIDYNNDLQYNALGANYPYGPERVFTGMSTPGNFYIMGSVTIPNAVIPETPTGLRVILNNDVNPNAAANLGAGAYTSGETEDYVVMFHRVGTSVGSTGLVKDFIMYPNPTEGRFTLGINSGKDIAKMDVVVTNITGQTVLARSFSHTGTQFTASLDLSTAARGVYFVEVKADGDRIVRKLVIR